MADNTVKFFIQLEGGQQIEVATGNLKKMGQETKKNTKTQREAAAAAGDFNYSLNQGVTGASSSAKSFSKMSQASNGLVGSYAALAASSFAISAGFNRLREAALAEQLLKGLETQGARTGLTLTVVADNMRTLTGNAISMAEGMQAASQMTAAGFSTQTMERLTKVATDAAAALGRNVPDAMDRIIKGTTKLEPELLDELGLMTKLDEATRLYATEIGKAPSQLTRFEKQQAFVNAVAAEGERKFAGLSDGISNLKSYDSLSAAFTDLGNSVLGFLNGALLPVANVLANNSVALTSVLVLFASTIIGQLLPALAEMAEKSSKAADAAKELATAKKDSIQQTINDAKATAQKNATEARGFAIHQKGAKAFKDRAAAIKAGSTSTEDFEGAIDSLNRSIKKYDDNIENGTYATQERIDAVKELKSELSAQILVLKQVQNLDAIAASESPDEPKVAAARKKANAAELASIIAQTTSESVEAASGGDFTDAFEKLNEGIASYKDKLNEIGEAGGFKKLFGNIKQAGLSIKSSLGGIVASTRAANGGLATLRVAFASAAGGAKILGLAITNMLPIIGQVLMVAGLLYEGVKWLYEQTKPEGSAALEKALEDQAERYKNVGEMAANLKRIGMDSAKSQVDSLTAVSNKVNEIADGYDAIKSAEAKLGKSPLEAASTGPNTLEGLNLGSDVVDAEAYKALEALTKSGYEPLSNSIIQAVANTKKLNDVNVTAGEKAKLLEGILKNTKKTFQDVGSNSKAFSDSLTALDKSVEEFSRSSVTSTPFDAIVRDLTETTATMYELEASMYRGAISAKDFGVQLSSISTRASGLLDTDVQKQLTQFNATAAEIAKLEKQRDSGELEYSGTLKLTDLTTKQANETARIGTLLSANIAKRQQELAELQNMARVNASLATMEAARFQKSSRGIEDSKELARAQDASAERQAALAVKTLDAQIKLQKGIKQRIEEEIKSNNDAIIAQQKVIDAEIAADKAKKERVQEISEYQLDIAKTLQELARATLESGYFSAFLIAGEEINNVVNKALETTKKFSSMAGKILKDTAIAALYTEVKKPVDIKFTASGTEAQAVMAELQATSVRLAAEIAGVNANIQQLDATKYGELAKLLTETQKGARDTGYDLNELLEGIGVINKLTQAAAAIELDREKINKSILGTFGQQINIRQKQLGIEIKAIEAEKQSQRETLKTNIERDKKLKADALESNDSVAVKLLEAQIKNQTSKLNTLNEEERILKDQARERSYILTLEEASFNVFAEGLEMQQRSLDVLRKRAELQSTILDQQQESRQLDADIAAAKTGQPIGERAQKTLDLQVAEEAFALAKEQLDLKLVGIRLEYELLEAQRIASVVDFKMKSQTLALEAARLKAEGKDSSQMTQMVDQLNSSINYLSTQSYKGLMNMAMEAEKRGVEILGKRAEKIKAELNGIGVIRTGADVFKQAINDAIISSKSNILVGKTEQVDGPVISSAEAAAKAQVDSNTALINSIDSKFPDLASSIQSLVEELKKRAGSLADKVTEATKASLPGTTGSAAGSKSATTGADTAEVVGTTKYYNKAAVAPRITDEQMAPKAVSIPEIPITGIPSLAETQKQMKKISFQETMDGFNNMFSFANDAAQPLLNTLKSLGPEGEAQAAVIQGVFSLQSTLGSAFKKMSEEGMSIGAAFETAAAVISGVQAILSANSQARIAGVDKEIAAEQKRDGKSAESVSKIQALEKKKDDIARKSFNTNKKLMMAQAVMATAAGIANALAAPTSNPVYNIVMAGIIGAMGAAQLAIIASTQYNGGSKSTAPATPSTLSIGKRSDTVDLARGPSANAGGEVGFLRGSQGMGTNASNFRTIGSAYGGELMRGYGNRGFVVGEKGPEVITPETPINVTPANDVMGSAPVNATINIQALDASGVENILVSQKGNIIKMLRQAANASGQGFLEDVNVNVYTRPNVNRL